MESPFVEPCKSEVGKNQGADGANIFDFKKLATTPAQKYLEITVIDLYTYMFPKYEEYTFDIENEADAHRKIKEFISKNEQSPDLVFQLGFCENPRCLKWRDELQDSCCKHRIDSFKYDADYTYIEGYYEVKYKIKIVL